MTQQMAAAKYTAAMNQVLTPLKMGDKTHAEVVGPQLCLFRDNATGQPVPAVGYLAMVVLEHNRLLGQDPLGISIGIKGLLPPQKAFEDIAATLLERCREMRDEANSPKPSLDEAAAVTKDAEAKNADAFAAKMSELHEKPAGPVEKIRTPRERESHFS
jgi:hypothetical protein